MKSTVVENDYDLRKLILVLKEQEMPFTVTAVKGRKRSNEQNRLLAMWIKEISEQLEGETQEEVRAFCKLAFGVPIRKEDSEAFTEKYNALFDPLPYRTKIRFMMEPFSFAVTRDMTTKQKSKYLDRMSRHYAGEGVILTQPQGPDNWGQCR